MMVQPLENGANQHLGAVMVRDRSTVLSDHHMMMALMMPCTNLPKLRAVEVKYRWGNVLIVLYEES